MSSRMLSACPSMVCEKNPTTCGKYCTTITRRPLASRTGSPLRAGMGCAMRPCSSTRGSVRLARIDTPAVA
jgi:hypothetical protein